jgi:hypothetical protein
MRQRPFALSMAPQPATKVGAQPGSATMSEAKCLHAIDEGGMALNMM